jgi:drug/metabolite transporter (DMT)-like permease
MGEQNANKAILILVLAQSILIFLDVSAKWLSATLPTAEIMFARYGVHVALLLVLVLPLQGLKLFRTGNWKLELARGLFLLGSTAGNFLAMRFLPLTVTGALLFTMPLMVCALSGPMLGEQVGWRRWLAVLVGFVGVLVIVRPFQDSWSWVAILPVLGALCGALRDMATRKITGQETSESILFYGALAVVVVGFTTLPFGWQWVAPFDLMLFALQGFAMGIAHYLMIESFRMSEAALVAPFKYTGFIWAMFYGAALWGDYPDRWTILGACVILASGLYILHRELLRRKA